MANPLLLSGAASDQTIYEEVSQTATNQSRGEGTHPVGTRAVLDDGRVFYYMSNGTTALTAGSLTVVPATTGLNRSADHNAIELTSSGTGVTAGLSTFVLSEADLDNSDIITNEYKDGYLYVENSTGEGHTFKIRGHSQFDASGTAATGTVSLFDPIVVGLAATSQISFARNPYDRIITSTTAEEEAPVGVTPIAFTASTALATDVTTAVSATTTYCGWVQTWGPCAVEVDDTTVASGIAIVSGDTADRVEAGLMIASTGATPTLTGFDQLQMGVGLVSAAAAGGDFVLVDLRIRP